MLNSLVQKRTSVLEDEIYRVRKAMLEASLDSEEYATLLGVFERLIVLRTAKQSSRVSPDTMAVVAANLLGILIVVGYEQGHVIASRGLAFLLKPSQTV